MSRARVDAYVSVAHNTTNVFAIGVVIVVVVVVVVVVVQVSMYQIFTEGMNQRLGTNCSDLECVSLHLTSLNQTMADVTAVPEMDAWRYDGGNTSMTCSMFAFQVWKNAFGNAQPWGGSQGNEQTPKDNYQMAIFDPAHFTDANCPGGVFTSAKGTYCQLMGPYVMDLNDYNSVPIYAGVR
jgi:hypothetical protein